MYLSLSYISSWFAVVLLSELSISALILQVSIELLLFLFFSALILLATEFLLSQKKGKPYFRKARGLKNVTYFFVIIFLILFLFTAAQTKLRFPILSFIGLDGLRYNEFGIPGLQGLINALYLCMMSIYFYASRVKEKVSSFLFLILLLYPILIVSRQVLIVLLIQIFIIWYLTSPMKVVKKQLYVVLYFIVAIFTFGIIGDLRVESDVTYSARDLLYSLVDFNPVADYLPNSFLWFYIYFVSPTTNLLLNIQYIEPSWEFSQYLSSLMPSPIRSALGLDGGFEGYDNVLLVSPNLNMSTAFLPAFMAFGWGGMIAHFLVMYIVSIFFILNRKKNTFYYLGYVSMIPIMFFSVFANLIFYLPVMFQLVLFFLLGASTSRRVNI